MHGYFRQGFFVNMTPTAVPYVATSIAVIARFVFMYLLYTKKSTNNWSLSFCILSIFSSGMWEYYSILNNDMPLIVRSSTEITLLSICALYIVRNKWIQSRIHPVAMDEVQVLNV
jgi:uncharacterized protein with PQ loop repeat